MFHMYNQRIKLLYLLFLNLFAFFNLDPDTKQRKLSRLYVALIVASVVVFVLLLLFIIAWAMGWLRKEEIHGEIIVCFVRSIYKYF